jgi:hypothetical protein
MDDAAHVRSTKPEPEDSMTWLWDEEATCSTKMQQPHQRLAPLIDFHNPPTSTSYLHQPQCR